MLNKYSPMRFMLYGTGKCFFPKQQEATVMLKQQIKVAQAEPTKPIIGMSIKLNARVMIAPKIER